MNKKFPQTRINKFIFVGKFLQMKNYDIIYVGLGAASIFAAYESVKLGTNKKIAFLEKGNPLEKRKCPIDGDKIKNCIHCGSWRSRCFFGC